jgi:hypothetical protein
MADSTHALAGAGAGAAGGLLVAAISGTWHLDPTLVGDWVGVGMGALTFLGSVLVWWIRWKWPAAPPLPTTPRLIVPPGVATREDGPEKAT